MPFSVAVTNIITKSNLGSRVKSSVSSYRSQPITEGNQGENSRQELEAKTTECCFRASFWLAQLRVVIEQGPNCLGEALNIMGWTMSISN